MNRIGKRLIDVIEKYSKDNGYGIILDTSFAADSGDVSRQPDRYHPRNRCGY